MTESEDSSYTEMELAGTRIIFGLNIGHGAFLVMLSLYGLIFVLLEAAVGLVIGLVLIYIAWIYIKPVTKEGWTYAFIVNIVSIPLNVILIPFPIWVFGVTFAILVVIFMLVPVFKKPFTG